MTDRRETIEAHCVNGRCKAFIASYPKGTSPEQQKFFCSPECYAAYMTGLDMCVAPGTQLEYAKKASGVE